MNSMAWARINMIMENLKSVKALMRQAYNWKVNCIQDVDSFSVD